MTGEIVHGPHKFLGSELSTMVTSSGLPSLSSLSIHLNGGARGRGRREGASSLALEIGPRIGNTGDCDLGLQPCPAEPPPFPAHVESADQPSSKLPQKPPSPRCTELILKPGWGSSWLLPSMLSYN